MMSFMDHINLVTCLHRLAKLTSQAGRNRAAALDLLHKAPTMALLLRECARGPAAP
jgi:hypothetical protein